MEEKLHSVYDSEEELAWGPPTLREVKKQLQRVPRKITRRESDSGCTFFYTPSTTFSEEKTDNKVNNSSGTSAYFTPNESLQQPNRNEIFLESLTKAIENDDDDVSSPNTPTSTRGSTLLNIIGDGDKNSLLENIHQTLVENTFRYSDTLEKSSVITLDLEETLDEKTDDVIVISDDSTNESYENISHESFSPEIPVKKEPDLSEIAEISQKVSTLNISLQTDNEIDEKIPDEEIENECYEINENSDAEDPNTVFVSDTESLVNVSPDIPEAKAEDSFASETESFISPEIDHQRSEDETNVKSSDEGMENAYYLGKKKENLEASFTTCLGKETENMENADYLGKEKENMENAYYLGKEKGNIQNSYYLSKEEENMENDYYLGKHKENMENTYYLSKEKENMENAYYLGKDKENIENAYYLSKDKENVENAYYLDTDKENIENAYYLGKEKENLENDYYLSKEKENMENAYYLGNEKENLESSFTSDVETNNSGSPKFNDTLEEMNMVLQRGLNYQMEEDEQSETRAAHEHAQKSTLSEGSVNSDVDFELRTPVKLKSSIPKLKKKLPTPNKFDYVQSPIGDYIKNRSPGNFKVPLKPVKSNKQHTPAQQNQLKHLKNIISPVGVYIKNSPGVCLKQNVPAKSFQFLKSPLSKSTPGSNRENNILPQVMYQPGKRIINSVEKDVVVPSSIEKMIREPTIVKHEIRVQVHGNKSGVCKKLLEENVTVVDSSILDQTQTETDISIVKIKHAFIK